MVGQFGDLMNPEEVRNLYPLLAERAFLFSGGLAPASLRTKQAIERFTNELTFETAERYKNLNEEYRIVQQLFAGLIGADQSEIVITDTTAAGSNLAVEMIERSPGTNVVVDHFGYGSSIYPWKLPSRQHIELRFVAPRARTIHIDDLAAAVDNDTIAISVSHVSEMTGFRHDLETIGTLAADYGAALLVDAMQSAGALQIDVHSAGVHFLSCGAMKWLLGSSGVGFFYCNEQYLQGLPPRAGITGFASQTVPWPERTLEPETGADRLRLGAPNLIGLAATKPGLEILHETGMQTVERHVLDLSGYCIDQLQSRDLTVLTPTPEHLRAGIVAIELENASEVCSHMASRGVDGWSYGNMLRVDPHIFNNRGDIDRFLAALDESSR